MKFEEFCREIEKEKENAKNYAWFVLVEAMKGEKITRLQFEAANAVLDRLEGKPAQKNIVSGDKEGLPVMLVVSKE